MLRALTILIICLAIAGSIVESAISASTVIFDMPSILVCAVIAFLVQWIIFVPSYLKQSEKFYDLAGSLSFIAVSLIALAASEQIGIYQIIITAMVVIWASRLGTFLFFRIKKDGKDDRFEKIKPDKYRFFVAWTVQGLWVFLTSSPVLVALTSSAFTDINVFVILGLSLWILGFVIEVVADSQKRSFKHNQVDTFITTGLWKYSRHPNYFGEILLWFGVAIAVLPALSGWQYIVLISPIFVMILLTKVSGIPMLEAKAEKKWGNQPEYEKYKQSTPVLVPWLGKTHK